MDIGRPEPGVPINTGETTVPRLAATVMLLRGGSETLEVLLVQRNPAARVMGGVWVFPGGSVDPGDGDRDGGGDGDRDGGGDGNRDGGGDDDRDGGGGDGQSALLAAAARELAEEVDIALAPSELVLFARWITPAQLLVRFDTWFYLAAAPEPAEPRVDGGEIVDFRWASPKDALRAADRDEIALVFPTIRQLMRLAEFPSATAALEAARGELVQAVEPRVVRLEGRPRVVLPGEPGYDVS